MATLKFLLAAAVCIVFISGCGSNPIESGQTNGEMNLSGYFDAQNTTYYKVFSDGTQNQFGGYDTINGRVFYVVVENSDLEGGGVRFYYDSRGAEGFQNPGEAITWYDQPFPNLPDRVPFKSLASIKTTYTYSGRHISVTTSFLLADTEIVGVPFGIFNGCAHFILQWKAVTDSIATYGTYDDWFAKGPGEVKYSFEDEAPILMETGNVNGVLWGYYISTPVPTPLPSPATPAGAAHLVLRSMAAAHTRMQ